MAFNYSPKVVTDGLVMYLDAGNNRSYASGSTSWLDLSRGGNDGGLFNGPTFNSANGGSIVFDGTNDFVQSTSVNGTGIMNPTLYNETISINIWLKSTSTRASQYAINTGAYTGGLSGFALVVNDGGIEGTDFISIASSTKNYLYSSGNFISTNQIANICFLSDGSNMHVYKNGSIIASVASSVASASPSSNGLVLGRPNNTNSFYFVGDVYNFGIYNKALSAQEVLQNYNALKGRFNL
jgi:hypothetical protein